MQYLYHPQAKEPFIALVENDYKYIIKARRHKLGEQIALRNLKDASLYLYQIETITKKEAVLKLVESHIKQVEAAGSLHIGWCVIDPKTIEKHIASLNEIGVTKITFIYCERSQQNFSIDFERLRKILINSSSQCGRSSIIELDTASSLELFLQNHPDSYMLNFSSKSIDQDSGIQTIVIGCEGGFKQSEIALFEMDKIVGFDTPLILKSESAAISVASKLLL